MSHLKMRIAAYVFVGISMTISALLSVLVGVPLVMPPGLPLDRALFYVFLLTSHVLLLIFGICVLNGLIKHKPKRMVPWNRAAVTIALILVVLVVIGTVMAIMSGDYHSLPVMAFYMAYACFLLVGAFIVYKLRNAIAKESSRQGAYAQGMLSAVADYDVL